MRDIKAHGQLCVTHDNPNRSCASTTTVVCDPRQGLIAVVREPRLSLCIAERGVCHGVLWSDLLADKIRNSNEDQSDNGLN